MIFNIGTDFVAVDRVRTILDKNKSNFLKKVLTPEEIEIAETKKSHLANFTAKRFAAKEALSKAFGKGIGEISFQDITILNFTNGMPYYKISSKLEKLAHQILNKRNYKLHLTLSDDRGYALAFAIIEII